MRNEKIIRATKGVLDFMFFSGIAVVVTLPWTLKLAGRYYDDTLQDAGISPCWLHWHGFRNIRNIDRQSATKDDGDSCEWILFCL